MNKGVADLGKVQKLNDKYQKFSTRFQKAFPESQGVLECSTQSTNNVSSMFGSHTFLGHYNKSFSRGQGGLYSSAQSPRNISDGLGSSSFLVAGLPSDSTPVPALHLSRVSSDDGQSPKYFDGQRLFENHVEQGSNNKIRPTSAQKPEGYMSHTTVSLKKVRPRSAGYGPTILTVQKNPEERRLQWGLGASAVGSGEDGLVGEAARDWQEALRKQGKEQIKDSRSRHNLNCTIPKVGGANTLRSEIQPTPRDTIPSDLSGDPYWRGREGSVPPVIVRGGKNVKGKCAASGR